MSSTYEYLYVMHQMLDELLGITIILEVYVREQFDGSSWNLAEPMLDCAAIFLDSLPCSCCKPKNHFGKRIRRFYMINNLSMFWYQNQTYLYCLYNPPHVRFVVALHDHFIALQMKYSHEIQLTFLINIFCMKSTVYCSKLQFSACKVTRVPLANNSHCARQGIFLYK